ncbi:MAG: exodeoxyribonuclease gamma subunit [Acidimicrobiales bacterium]|nr:exodeoxyribonuclease gamma subunit [Acidimicrobiales bacterium]
MALHVHHASHLVPLVDSLAGVLATPLADPFAPEVVAVPTAGIRDWLVQQLALRLGTVDQLLDYRAGIAANIEMVFPGRFTAAVLGRDLDESSPWDIDRLTWSVLAAVEAGDAAVPGWRIGRAGAYATARHIADLFDGYATNRPQVLQQWAAGHDGDGTLDEHGAIVPMAPDHRWQPLLWRAIRASIGVPNPAELLPDLLADLRSGRIEPALPDRTAMFGVSAVSTAQLTVLRALGAVRDVHLYLVHPSAVAWSGVRQQLAGRLVLRSACDATAAVHHPLLRSWARPALEAAVLVGGFDDSVRVVGHDDGRQSYFPGRPASATPTLLGALQRTITDDIAPAAVSDASRTGTGRQADTSVQVHACHGTVRQLEVLRDALGHILAADPTITAPDVIVLCPDLQRFAALIPSVFRRSTLPIPVRVTDLSLGTDNPVAGALVDVLTALAGRCTAPEIHSVCALAPVRQRFGFDDEGLERIGRWIGELGISWGLDGDHRGRWVPDTIAEGTWSAALDRLFLGAAMPSPTPRVGPGEIVPFDDMDAAALGTAGQLAELIRRLDRLRRLVDESRSIEDWVVLLTALVNDLFATVGDDTWQSIEVMETLAKIGTAAGGTAAAVPLALGDIRSLLGEALADPHGRLNLRSGSVTVTAMVPVRNIPARVVCLLGLDEQALRSSGGDGDDLLSVRPCVGERDPRAERRHLLLDALMSAGDHLVITCDGSDITTNRLLPLPVQVEELLDAVHAFGTAGHVVVRHPRQAYDERNFGVAPNGTPVEPFSFDTSMLAAAQLRRQPPAGTSDLDVLGPVVPAFVTTAQLAEAVTRPARTFLGQRLDARLPRAVDEIETDIPLAADNLELWDLARELLDHRRAGSDDEALQRWRDAKRRGGTLPPRALALAVLDDVSREVEILLGARADMSELITSTGRAELDLPIDVGDGHTIRLRQPVEGIADHLVVRVEFSRPKHRHEIAAALELAGLVLSHPDVPWESLVVLRPTSGSSKPTVHHLRTRPGPDGVEAARRLLRTASRLYLRALREPIPMFDKSSRSMYDDATILDEEFESDLRDNDTGFVWGEATADEVLAIPVRADDLPEVHAAVAADGAGRAVGLARCFWSAFDGFIAAPEPAGAAKTSRRGS